MSDARRTLVAGLSTGGFFVVVAFLGPGADPLAALQVGGFVVLSTLVMTGLQFRALSLVLTWCIPVAFITYAFAIESADPWDADAITQGLVAGAWLSSLTVLPWLITVAVVRHFLLPSATRRRYMNDLHSR